jgi:hypothetical protein
MRALPWLVAFLALAMATLLALRPVQVTVVRAEARPACWAWVQDCKQRWRT